MRPKFLIINRDRVAGITAALAENKELASEQVSVIFIAHSQTDQGMKKTRKLFSTLNRRAKPVGKMKILLLMRMMSAQLLPGNLFRSFHYVRGTIL